MAIRDGIHIRMTLLEYILPYKIQKLLHFFAYVVLLALHLAWVFAGWQVVQLTLIPKMPATQFSMAVLFSSVFVSAALGIIMTVSRLIKGEW
jgi:TRAP-type C4-dicarboxylate transport system permease small subunit